MAGACREALSAEEAQSIDRALNTLMPHMASRENLENNSELKEDMKALDREKINRKSMNSRENHD